MPITQRVAFWFPDLYPARQWLSLAILYEDHLAALLPVRAAWSSDVGPEQEQVLSQLADAGILTPYTAEDGDIRRLIDDLDRLHSPTVASYLDDPPQQCRDEAHLRNLDLDNATRRYSLEIARYKKALQEYEQAADAHARQEGPAWDAHRALSQEFHVRSQRMRSEYEHRLGEWRDARPSALARYGLEERSVSKKTALAALRSSQLGRELETVKRTIAIRHRETWGHDLSPAELSELQPLHRHRRLLVRRFRQEYARLNKPPEVPRIGTAPCPPEAPKRPTPPMQPPSQRPSYGDLRVRNGVSQSPCWDFLYLSKMGWEVSEALQQRGYAYIAGDEHSRGPGDNRYTLIGPRPTIAQVVESLVRSACDRINVHYADQEAIPCTTLPEPETALKRLGIYRPDGGQYLHAVSQALTYGVDLDPLAALTIRHKNASLLEDLRSALRALEDSPADAGAEKALTACNRKIEVKIQGTLGYIRRSLFVAGGAGAGLGIESLATIAAHEEFSLRTGLASTVLGLVLERGVESWKHRDDKHWRQALAYAYEIPRTGTSLAL